MFKNREQLDKKLDKGFYDIESKVNKHMDAYNIAISSIKGELDQHAD